MSSLDRFLGGGVTALNGLASVNEAPAQEDLFLWPDGLRHLSATSIGMFRRCPEQFRHRYVLGEKERPGEGLVIGSMFHQALGWNYGQKISSHEDRPTVEVVQYLQDEAIPKVLEENGGASEIAWDSDDPKKGEEIARKDSERILVRYHEDVAPRVQPVAVEEQFYLTDPSLPVPLLGYVDTREEGRIVDPKTGKQSVSKLKPSWMLQATLYSAMTGLQVEYHSISRAARPKITTGLESPDLVFQPNPVKTQNVINSAAQIAKMIAWLYQTYGPDETWPTMGRFADWSMSFSPCQNCGWRTVCPAMHGEV